MARNVGLAKMRAESGVLMCRTYSVEWHDLDGNPILDGAPKGFVFPDDADEDSLPVCTCWMADGSPEGDALYARFMEMLKPMLDVPICGKLEIQVL